MAAHADLEKFEKKKVTNFFVGLKDEDELVFEKTENKLCRIKRSTPSLENKIKFKDIAHLEEQLLTALQKAKESMVDGDTCSLSTRIMDEPYWDIEPGSYKCSEIANKKIRWHDSKGIAGKIKRNYQTTPETKNQLAVEFRIDGDKDTLSYRTLTDDVKDYDFIDVGHGYFLYPDKQYTSFVIVDPRKRNAIIILLTIHSAADPEYESFVRKFHDKLKNKIIEHPEGYSVEKMYAFRNMVWKLSHETEILVQEFKIGSDRVYAKLHFVDKKLVSKMSEKEWKEEDVTTMIEESLVQIDNLLSNVA
ncbi:uncharacterized protein LOC130641215 isoform X2 [Hydractinia symbiolongicarpus]|nr:uncharacterized protein LOC130641215 isoform X2 [Hydractinia symbiolongicarpus]XP_057303908.1 uncharacterized protein LOC130641215 isoform X2 [Hydractinia symbiolongicarpus]XP_057303909.1 uncharacterized protein LOC130641215 isoform X2 [Hydractinia symbiolongicarpus]XP_057303910.1 uncharacterized protein LOC130641215 isoform X2 [Hydractinia symbiolongicarpus]